MANKILQDNDPEVTKREKKKDKKKKKKSRSSSSESSDECAQIGLEELQLQCGLKPKHLGLRDLVRIDDLKPEARFLVLKLVDSREQSFNPYASLLMISHYSPTYYHPCCLNLDANTSIYPPSVPHLEY
jgi:hypothetical protein